MEHDKQLNSPARFPFALATAVLALLGLAIPGCGDGHDCCGSDDSYQPQTRTYFVAAEHTMWNFAPLGFDPVYSQEIPMPFGEQLDYDKIRYIQYTDSTFMVRVEQPEWQGILGPTLRGVVGDTLVVHFLNRTHQNLSMHPHGLRYDKDHEGAAYAPKVQGAAVAPGERHVYTWQADADSGPAPGEPSSKVWLYHSHVDEEADVMKGTVGTIIITEPSRARDDATPTDVDREFVTLFLTFDETMEPGGHGIQSTIGPANADSMNGHLKHSINGLIFGNLQGLEMNLNDRVRWYVVGLGSERDIHTPHWHGEVGVLDGRSRTDVAELLPASMHVVDMVTDNPGTWLYHCHVAGHVDAGMYTTFQVH